MKKARVALYIRVSTDAQFEEGYSVDAQKEMLASYCKSRQLGEYQYYVDGGFSGSNIERPELQRLIEQCKIGQISHVIVYKLDRLSRSQKDTLYLIEDVFLPHNVDFISINESFDTSTAFGRAMIGILSVFAQLERENIRMRTRMGMKERVKSGLWPGGGRVPFGYDYDKNLGYLIPNEDAKTVRKIYDLYLAGYGAETIANMLGMKYDRLVMQILMRKTNIGVICYNEEEYKGKHDAIISDEIYYNAMEMMKQRSVQKIATTNYLLTGLLYCGKCGAKMRYQKWGKSGTKIYCYSQQKSKKYLIKDPNCDNEKAWADEVEDVVIKDLFHTAFEKTEGLHATTELDIMEMLHKQYEECSKKIKRLYALYASSENNLLLETIEEHQKELKQIQAQIKKEQERHCLTNKAEEIQKRLANVEEMWEYMSVKEKQDLLRSCIERVTIADNRVDIRYQFLVG